MHFNTLEMLRDLNSELINGTQLRFIIMFGENSERSLISEQISKYRIRFDLPLGTVDGFLEVDSSSSSSVKRVYLRSPVLLSTLSSRNLKKVQELGDIFRFVAIMTQTPQIRTVFFANLGLLQLVSYVYMLLNEMDKKR